MPVLYRATDPAGATWEWLKPAHRRPVYCFVVFGSEDQAHAPEARMASSQRSAYASQTILRKRGHETRIVPLSAEVVAP